MIANMHAITVRQTPADLRRQTREAAALLLACGKRLYCWVDCAGETYDAFNNLSPVSYTHLTEPDANS